MSEQKSSVNWRVHFSDEERVTRFVRPDLLRACYDNDRIAAVLNYFLYQASREADNQKLPADCKVVTLQRTHKEIAEKLNFNLSRKTLISYLDKLNEWGYVRSERYHSTYTVDFEATQTAIDNPPVRETPQKGCKVVDGKGCRVTTLQPSNEGEKVVELQHKVVELQHKVVELQHKVELFTTLQPLLTSLLQACADHFPDDPRFFLILPDSSEGDSCDDAIAHHDTPAQSHPDSYSHEQATGSDLDEIGMMEDEEDDFQGETLHMPVVKVDTSRTEKGQTNGKPPVSGTHPAGDADQLDAERATPPEAHERPSGGLAGGALLATSGTGEPETRTAYRATAPRGQKEDVTDAASHLHAGTQPAPAAGLPDRPADLLPASSPDVRPVLGSGQGEAGTPGIESDHIAPVSDTQSASQTDSATDQRYPSSPVAAPLPPDEAIPPAASEVPPASGRGKKPKKVDLLLLCEPSVVRARLIAFRGYALEEKGAIIDENKKIREWCEKHTADELDFVMKALESDPYWGKAEHRLHFFAKNFALETPKKLTGHVPCARPSDSDAPDYQRPDGTIDYLKFAMWKARHPEPISTAAGGMQ